MKEIFLIERAWTDSMENDVSDAFGYAPHAFVETEAEAQKIVAEGGLAPECWANRSMGKLLYRYVRLEPFSARRATSDG